MIGPYYVTNEEQRFKAWGKPGTPGVGGQVELVTITMDGRSLQVNKLALAAFLVYEQIRVHHNYRLTGTDTGFYSYRHMRHDPDLPWSVHAWAMALDINWLENPAGSKLVTDIPDAMIQDLYRVQTVSGAYVFRWGADWDRDGEWIDHSYVDAMHWECVAHPLDLATGIQNWRTTVEKIPLTTWALPTFEWAINNGYYTEETDITKVRETYEFQQQMVVWHRALMDHRPEIGLTELEVKSLIARTRLRP